MAFTLSPGTLSGSCSKLETPLLRIGGFEDVRHLLQSKLRIQYLPTQLSWVTHLFGLNRKEVDDDESYDVPSTKDEIG